jgi:hypothetical protein
MIILRLKEKMNKYITYSLLILGIFIALVFLLRALQVIILGLIRIIKNFRKLGRKEFMNKLKDGVERISPIQKTKAELRGMIITLLGIITGLIATPIIRVKGVWFWVEIILVGSFIISIVQLISKMQLYSVQKKQDEIIKSLEKKRC